VGTEACWKGTEACWKGTEACWKGTEAGFSHARTCFPGTEVGFLLAAAWRMPPSGCLVHPQSKLKARVPVRDPIDPRSKEGQGVPKGPAPGWA